MNITLERLIELYKGGSTLNQLSVVSGLSAESVRRRLVPFGVIRGRGYAARRYRQDDSFFDVIDTEEKAYWLGFLFADGNVRSRSPNHGEIRLSLKISDREHVEKFKAAIKSQSPICVTHRGVAVTLTVTSRQLFDALVRLGCVPNKTNNHGTPKLPDHLVRHFYRGYIDGDGCIYVKGVRVGLFILGPAKFLTTLRAWIQRKTRLPGRELQLTGDNNVISRLDYGGGQQVQYILDHIYGDSQISLSRKLQKYQEVCCRNS